MMGNQNDGEKVNNGSRCGNIPRNIYAALAERLPSGIMRSCFDDGVSIGGDGVAIVGATSPFVLKRIRDYDGPICAALASVGLGGQGVKYVVDEGLRANVRARQAALPLETESVDYESQQRIRRLKICAPHGCLEGSCYDGGEPILHDGNRATYNALGSVFDLLASGRRQASPLVIRGTNGLGKTHALRYLLHRASKNGIPAIAASVDGLAKDLRPSSNAGLNKTINPKWYDLAMGGGCRLSCARSGSWTYL